MNEFGGNSDLQKPLGQLSAAARPARFRPRIRAVSIAVLAIAVAAASATIALRDRGLRNPAAAVVATVEQPASTGSIAEGRDIPAATKRRDTDGGPSIIEVGPPPTERDSVVIIRNPATVGQNLRVAHLPDKALIEKAAAGPLPVRASDGRRPFDVYARPWSGARGARVAIVIGGLGVSQTGTQHAVETLPGEVTLAFAANGNSLDRWMQAARRSGHEIVMQVPLEPFDYPNVDPGRTTLTVSADPGENADNLHWALSRITNYTGIMNYMGARFTSERSVMKPLMDELGERGLLYLDDGSSARSLAGELAPASGVPFAAADTAIDADRSRPAILKKLDDLERIAQSRGYAIGIGWAFDTTVDAVSEWIGEARRRGIEIVPVSAVAADPERR